MSEPELSFEQALARLEQIVAAIESPQVTLDQTLSLFQEGKRLSGVCQARLTAVEKRVSQLLEDNNGDLHLEPFEPENPDEDDEE